MTNEIAIKNETQLLLAAAEEEGSGVGRLLKYSKGHYFANEDEVPIGTKLIAHTRQFTRGWVKFVGGRLVEQKIGRVIDGFALPPREDLGDTDESAWEMGNDGRPRDPWVKQLYLPFEYPETREVLTFVTGTAGGRTAVRSLVTSATRTADRGSAIVKLATRTQKHSQYGRIEHPDFQIVGWSAEPTVTKVKDVTPAFTDDEIPF